mgnify:CR=1 FL=1
MPAHATMQRRSRGDVTAVAASRSCGRGSERRANDRPRLTKWRVPSTVISNRRRAPPRWRGASMQAIATRRFSVGDHVVVVALPDLLLSPYRTGTGVRDAAAGATGEARKPTRFVDGLDVRPVDLEAHDLPAWRIVPPHAAPIARRRRPCRDPRGERDRARTACKFHGRRSSPSCCRRSPRR